MFIVKKRLEISASHKLNLPYESKCSNLHGHNWILEITCASECLDASGMVCDFTRIKKSVTEALDHQDITDRIVLNGVRVNPTAENIALFVATLIGDCCIEVSVQESEGNVAIWKK